VKAVDIHTGTILVSLIVYIVVGNYAGRRVKKLDDYFVAGRRAPTVLIVGTLVASLLTTNMFLGETGFVYEGPRTESLVNLFYDRVVIPAAHAPR